MYWLIFILATLGLFNLFSITPFEVFEELRNFIRSRAAVDYSLRPRRKIYLEETSKWMKWRALVESLLDNSQITLTFTVFLQFSLICAAIGGLLGLYVQNGMLSFVLALGLFFTPTFYLQYLNYTYVKSLNNSINLGLALITNSYIQLEDIVKAIYENLSRLEEPLKQVISEFIIEIEIINPNIPKAITNMQRKVHNRYFHRWCDILLQCQDDRDFKDVLPAIVSEMADAKKHQSEYDAEMFTVYKSHFQLTLIAVLALPVLKAIFEEMYIYLVNTVMGKFLVAVMYAIVFIATGYVIFMNKPVSIS